jgi:hypothetical protein
MMYCWYYTPLYLEIQLTPLYTPLYLRWMFLLCVNLQLQRMQAVFKPERWVFISTRRILRRREQRHSVVLYRGQDWVSPEGAEPMLSILWDCGLLGRSKAANQADVRCMWETLGLYLLWRSLCGRWNRAIWVGALTNDSTPPSLSFEARRHPYLWIVCS